MKHIIILSVLFSGLIGWSSHEANSLFPTEERLPLEGTLNSREKIQDLAGYTQTDSLKRNASTPAGIISMESRHNFKDTHERLKKLLEENVNISIIAELDHQQNAAGVDLELRPARIIIFGNPRLGTPLMQENLAIGLDLPQKMLVWENEAGQVLLSYTDPYYLAERYSLEDQPGVLAKIAQALENLALKATGD